MKFYTCEVAYNVCYQRSIKNHLLIITRGRIKLIRYDPPPTHTHTQIKVLVTIVMTVAKKVFSVIADDFTINAVYLL